MAKWIGGLLLALAAGVVVGYQARLAELKPPWNHEQAPRPAISPRGATVKAQGRIEPHGGVIGVGALPGARIAAVKVNEGDEVAPGAVLVELEGLPERRLQVELAEVQLREAEAALKVEDEYAAALSDEVGVEKEQVEKLEPIEIQIQTAAVAGLTARRDAEAKEVARLKSLRTQNVLSRQEEEQAELLLARTSKELEAARLMLGKLEAGRELNQKRLAVSDRKARLTGSRARAAARLDSLRKGVELARAELDRASVRAPMKATVLRVHARAGEVVGPRPLVQLGDVSRMALIAEVHEDSRALVRVGQTATATSPALPDQPSLHGPSGALRLTGTVDRIGWTVARNDILGLDPASDAYARVVEVRVLLDPEAGAEVRQLTNLQVSVSIDTTVHRPAEGP